MLEEHLGYLSDRVRYDQFKAAVTRVVQPGERVVDLGCGSGVLGLLCLQAGAAWVHAIDSTAMIEVARETLIRAGLSDRVEFIREHSHRVELAELADVVICDQVGFFGFDYGIVHTLRDAQRRFLKPDGRLIPRRIRLQLSAVQSDKCRDKVDRWRAEPVAPEFHWLGDYATNTKHAVELRANEVLSAPADLGEIDLRQDKRDFFSWEVNLRIRRDGVMHGLAGWFQCELAEGVWLTNSPLVDQRSQRPQAFFPIEKAVQVETGDRVQARVLARPAENLIAWTIEFPASGQRFSHSTWQGMVLAPEDLMRASPTRVPRLSRQGRARMTVLSYCDGHRTAAEIEQAILLDHTDLMPSPDEISRFVAQVLSRDIE